MPPATPPTVPPPARTCRPRRRATRWSRARRTVSACCVHLPRLIREGPCPHVRAQSAPNTGKPERLEHQEEHDERSEDELVEHEDRDAAAPGAVRDERDRRAERFDNARDQHQEEGPGDRSVPGA